MSLNALTAAHKVLVPLELHIMGVQGLARLMNNITTVKDRLIDSLIQPISHNGYATAVLEEDDDTHQQHSQKKTRSQKQRITVQISVDVIERVKNAVYWTPGLTLAALAEEALSKAVDELEGKNGEAFSKRKDELKTGRPLS